MVTCVFPSLRYANRSGMSICVRCQARRQVHTGIGPMRAATEDSVDDHRGALGHQMTTRSWVAGSGKRL